MQSLTSYFRLFVTLFGLTTLASCNLFPKEEPVDCPSQTEYYTLDAEAKAQIPYKGYDTIHMVSNTGDTLHLIGTGKQPFATQDFEMYSNPACGNNGTTKVYEAYKVKFENKRIPTETIVLNHYKRKIITSNDFHPNAVEYIIRSNYFIVSDFLISDSRFPSFSTEIILNNRTYKKVIKVYNDYTDSSSFILMNKANGILKISLNNATTVWEVY